MKINLNMLFMPLMLACSSLQAAEVGGVTIGGTRLIYEGGKKEAAISVNNTDKAPFLIQSWTESQNAGAEKAPFIVTPPLFRLDGLQQNMLRVIRTGGNLPEDRESLFWLNVKTIPASSENNNTNTLQIAVKTRLKLIYRPQSLKDVPETVANKLTWNQSGNQLKVTNPTPFYMNFQQIKVGGRELKNVTFVAPMSTATFDTAGAVGNVTWKIITDYGGASDEYGKPN